jgi:hypothetical protein
MLRNARLVALCALAALMLPPFFEAPPAGATNAWAGACAFVGAPVSFSPGLAVAPGSTTASFSWSTSCVLNGQLTTVTVTASNWPGTAATCNSGVYQGSLAVFAPIAGTASAFGALTVTGGNVTLAVASLAFAASGEFVQDAAATAACVANSVNGLRTSGVSWTGVLAFEDPTVTP